MADTLADSVAYYVALLALQYRTKDRATQNIAIYVKQALADMMVYQLRDCFEVDTAQGQQLDILGKYVGVPRTSGEPIPKPYFGFVLYAGSSTPNPNGMRRYGNPATNANGVWLEYTSQGTQNTYLPDQALALLIKLKIFLNSNDATLGSIQRYLRTYLTGLVSLVDNADMTLTYTVTGTLPPSITYNVLKPYLPKPMGVGINLVFFTINIIPASGGSPLTTLNQTVFSSSTSVTVTTSLVAGSAVNGLYPFTWSWNYVSGDVGVGIIIAPFPYTAEFTALVPINTTRSAVWSLTATDSRGLVAVAALLTVNLTHLPPP